MDVKNAARWSKLVQMGLLLTVVKMARAPWIEKSMIAQESQSLFLQNWDSGQTALQRIDDGGSIESYGVVDKKKIAVCQILIVQDSHREGRGKQP